MAKYYKSNEIANCIDALDFVCIEGNRLVLKWRDCKISVEKPIEEKGYFKTKKEALKDLIKIKKIKIDFFNENIEANKKCKQETEEAIEKIEAELDLL